MNRAEGAVQAEGTLLPSGGGSPSPTLGQEGTLPLPGGDAPLRAGQVEGTLPLPGIEPPAPRGRRRREARPMQPVSCLPKELPEEEGELPPFIAVEDITRASKFSEHTVRKHIRRLGLAEKIGGRLWIAREKLRDGWPSLYERLRELLGRGCSPLG